MFNLAIAENHIPICSKTYARPKPPKTKEEAAKLQNDRRIKHKRAQSVNAQQYQKQVEAKR